MVYVLSLHLCQAEKREMDERPGWRYHQTGEQPVCYGGLKVVGG